MKALVYTLRRRTFTLLEILIVISLLALFAGIAGFNGFGLISKQEFQAEKDKVRDRLQAARNVSVIFNSDVIVTFTRDPLNKTFWLRMESEKILPEPLNGILKEAIKLKAIQTITTENQSTEYVEAISIKFYGKSHTTSQGSVTLIGKPGKDLIELPHDFSAKYDNEKLYPREIRDDWRNKSISQNKKT